MHWSAQLALSSVSRQRDRTVDPGGLRRCGDAVLGFPVACSLMPEVIMSSFLTHLQCTACNETFPPDRLMTTCPVCGKVLFARYDLPAAAASMTRAALAERPWNLWRYAELLPVRDPRNILTLGEGGTPLLAAPALGRALGLNRLLV